MSFATPIHTNEGSIERVLKLGVPVVLVFWSRDSQSSKQLDPALSRLAIRYEGRALIAKVNCEDNPKLVEEHKVEAVPTLVFFKEGQEVARAAGAAPEDSLHSWLAHLADGGARPPLPQGPSEPLRGEPGAAGAGAGKPIELSDANFEQLINGPLPVLVDFWAPWCGPCRVVAPSVEQLAREFAGRAIVGKLNIDENPRTAQRYGIMSIPALFVFKAGRPVDRAVGAHPLPTLRQLLARHVA